MKRCLNCSHVFESLDWHCPNCGWEPGRNGNLPIFSPELAHSNTYFKASSFAPLAEREANHFWFRGRNSLILWAIEKYGTKISSFMEIGCGTGFVLKGISRFFPNIHLYGADIYPEGIAFAADRISSAEFIQMDARLIPFVDEFNAVGLFDVLEHIGEDETVLRRIYETLKSDGLLLLTVPQHRWLWSTIDEYACHVRRYTAQELHDKVIHAGFTILRSTSFITSLLPFMFLSRVLQRRKKENFDPTAEIQINPVLNRILEGFLYLELLFIRMGLSFPIGGSRLVVARKIEKTKL